MPRGSARNNWPDDWAALARAVGGVEYLAALLGVHRNTLRSWAGGKVKPWPFTKTLVVDTLTANGLPVPQSLRED